MASHEYRFGDEEPSSPPDELPAPDEAGATGPNPESSRTKRQDDDIKNARLLGKLVTNLVAEPAVQTAETDDKSRTRTEDNPATKPLILDIRRRPRFDPQEISQAQAIYDQLEGPDRELIARRFGFDGHQPHTYKEVGAVFGYGTSRTAYQIRRLIANESDDKFQGASLQPSELAQAQAIYDQLEGADRELIARRFAFDGHDRHTYKEVGAVFGYSTNWAQRQTKRLIVGKSVNKNRGARLQPSELTQAQAIYDQLEGSDQDLIARRFGFDGHGPHTYKEMGAVFGRSELWAYRQTKCLIADEPLSDTQLDRQALTISLNATLGARLRPSELVRAQAIYDQLEGQDQDLIARRFGFDGHNPHTYKEIGAAFGRSGGWAGYQTRRLIAGESSYTQLGRQTLTVSLDANRGARLQPSELTQAQAIYDQLEGSDQDLIARRFGFDGHGPHTYKEIGAVFGRSEGWAGYQTRRLIAGESADKRRGGRFNPSELAQAQAIYDQLEGPDQDLIARRFGFDGHDPHTYKEMGAAFGRSKLWAYRQTKRLIAGESVDKFRGVRLRPSELVRAQAIYDQLEGQPRELIARRFGFDGYSPQGYREIGEAFGRSPNWGNRSIRKILANESLDRGARFSPQELDQARAVYDQLGGPDQDLNRSTLWFRRLSTSYHQTAWSSIGMQRRGNHKKNRAPPLETRS